MSETVETFLLFCRALKPGLEDAELAELRRDLSARLELWPTLIDLANRHYLTPALWAALEDKGLVDCLPADGRAFLEQAHQLNMERNTAINAQALELVRALNREGITPVMLKGGVHLFEGNRRAFETRMMVDLDLLVPRERLEVCVRVAGQLGYGIIARLQDWTHEYHPLGRPGDLASVEFHRDVGEQRHLISSDDAFRRAVRLDPEDLQLLALSPTHRVLHNAFHSEIQDRNHGLWRMPLRYLHDLTLILHRHGEEIDWPAARAAMAEQGYGDVLDAYIFMGHHLFGAPRARHVPDSPGARRHFQCCLAQIRFGWLRSLLTLWNTFLQPFGRWRIDYIYGPAPNRLVLNFNRLRRAAVLAKKYNYRLLNTVPQAYRRIQSK